MQHEESLLAILDQRAATEPEGVPFCYLADGEQDEQPLTYRAFESKAKALAASLQEEGLKGERVLLLFPQGIEYLVALFGCFYAGAIAVPAYPPRNNRNLKRLLDIMDNCGSRYIMSDRDGTAHIQRLRQDFSDYRLLTFEDEVEAGKEWQAWRVPLDGIAYLQYTSGSTGAPKGVIITHRNLVENVKGLRETYQPYQVDTMVTWIPMYHDMGLLSMMTALTIGGGTCYFMSPVHFVQQPARWLQAISKYGAQYSVGPNFAFDLCCEKIAGQDMAGLDLSCLKSITNGSEPVRLSTLLAFHEKFSPYGFDFAAFCPGYGLAEATLGVSTLSAEEQVQIVPKAGTAGARTVDGNPPEVQSPEQYWVGCGHIVRDADVQIVDPNALEALPEGKEGEIWVHHAGFVAQGYWDNEAATAHTFGNELAGQSGKRYMRTGDLGFVQEGQLYVTGRIKDMIIIRGANYYPQDIERVVENAHGALEQNACAAFAHEAGAQEQLIVVQEVKRTEWRAADPEETIQAIRQQLSEVFEIAPHQIVLIRPMSLPKTSSGKVQRQATREAWLQGELRVLHEWVAEAPAAAPASGKDTAEEITVASITAVIRQKIAEKAKLPLEEVSPQAAVQDFPLESIEAIFLSDELSEWLGLKLTPDTMWALGSIEELANFLYERYQEGQG
ncbi:MAG: AMP-binding protein [Bacteroidetes bacterium]|jgi:acyl-CoA synthetase (AMP-forming)/AMP-acid ligase II/acyl carrier protein|nr:AMP-binding protein [Bacteroidota bacterium]